MIRLSELDNNVEISQEGGTILTVAEMRNEILLKGASALVQFSIGGEWYVIERKRWRPNAATMISDYIEHESQDMYEGWDESAEMCINPEVVAEMQNVLDKAFAGDFATEFYTYNEPVLIDVAALNVIKQTREELKSRNENIKKRSEPGE